ncbi:FAD-dependent monooxygenase [Streptomyces cocklensis]|uniref:3-(3-hydroxy-phenyl)propionate hydroxylase n=1 Tax=Actinacidiphila cocklensis TaxID=887465 RepID=A0A9W4DS16_9ACTN|nr:FAD-dependent monooxygenase [Actinacidiphila cocklensis]MDD1059664.1 FAD-dependent monooxygenase [Actinacidiphila cocklensis]WSX76424.1 FAD-dependent monooxygenase [Streptomyces sp. NBC_00899]CAG6392948.1 3-(3-hydroxy-phenyl)propionate hydroxylase [Actinacidiphila cocklensis]
MDPVIVAGAGPVGLTLALALARRDVPVILLDEAEVIADAEGLRRSRTAVLGPAAVALVERLGFPAVRDDGATWTGWRTVRRRAEVARIDFGADDAPVHIAQHRLENGLRQALLGCGSVRIVAGCRVDALEQDARGITVHTTGSHETWWRGSYLVGCDGPRSTVRKLLGVRFPGRTAVDRHAVAVVRADLPEPGVALLHRDPPGAPAGQEVTARPLPEGLWRLDWLLPVQARPLTPDALVERLRGTLTAWCGSVVPYEVVGSADYSVHQRLARRWRSGRAFLAGDAAHLMGALGAQSVEEGLRDAENLSWKLALAWHDGGSKLLLNSYEAERRGAVGARLRATDQVLPLLRASGTWQTVRQSLLSGSARGQAELLTDSHLGRGAAAVSRVYGRSPLALPAPRSGGGKSAASPLVAGCDTPPGGQVADVQVTALDGTVGRLRDRLGQGLVVVLVAPGTGVWESRHWLTAGLMPRLASAVAALPTPAELLVAETYPGATAHSVLLIRPDGHLVTAMVGCRPAELYSYADLARGGPPAAVGGDEDDGQGGGQHDDARGAPESDAAGTRVSGPTR